jgi:CDP-2,3-bis-(O-geranylgeranyl)-sn-glycerol synthase
MISILIFSFWYFLPAGIANMAPPIAAHISFLRRWDTPLDFGKTYRGIRIFGGHKTLRGLLVGLLCGTLTCILQAQIIPVPYNPTILGFLLSLGALGGDAIKSFFKRRTDIPPGKTWFPFDQLDYILGGLFLSSFYFIPPFPVYLGVFVLYFGLHLLFSYFGFLLHLKTDPI